MGFTVSLLGGAFLLNVFITIGDEKGPVPIGPTKPTTKRNDSQACRFETIAVRLVTVIGVPEIKMLTLQKLGKKN